MMVSYLLVAGLLPRGQTRPHAVSTTSGGQPLVDVLVFRTYSIVSQYESTAVIRESPTHLRCVRVLKQTKASMRFNRFVAADFWKWFEFCAPLLLLCEG
jgi:hypothetical protein